MLTSEEIKKEIKRILNEGIVLNHKRVKRDNYAPEEISEYLQFMVTGGFWSVDSALYNNEPCSEELAKDVYKAYLRERIDELEGSDLCGAPWCRVELKNLRYIYKNLDDWWKNE